jgi:hypothetical protein
MGVLAVAWSSATMIGPALGVVLYHFNPSVLWVVVTAISLVAAGVIMSTTRAFGTVKAHEPVAESEQTVPNPQDRSLDAPEPAVE